MRDHYNTFIKSRTQQNISSYGLCKDSHNNLVQLRTKWLIPLARGEFLAPQAGGDSHSSFLYFFVDSSITITSQTANRLLNYPIKYRSFQRCHFFQKCVIDPKNVQAYSHFLKNVYTYLTIFVSNLSYISNKGTAYFLLSSLKPQLVWNQIGNESCFF